MTKKKNVTLIHITMFALLWVFIIIVLAFLDSENCVDVIPDAFGKITFYMWVIFGVASLSSVVWLRIIVKNEKLIYIIAYSATIIFVLIGAVLIYTGTAKFEKFSAEYWKKYPAQRIEMYSDLEEKRILQNTSADNVINVLGKPDSISNVSDNDSYNTVYTYECGHNNTVYIYLKDNFVVSMGYVE